MVPTPKSVSLPGRAARKANEVESKTVGDSREDALSDISSVDGDAVPHQKKAEINNEDALNRIRASIQLDPSLPWTEILTISYPDSISVDVDDDLKRELTFYKQALHAATSARAQAHAHDLPFTRPSDYFAEMVKSDSHMERIRQRLLDERAGIKKAVERRREREGKKFGKQVQVEKLRERERSKKQMEERLKGLKRKRKDVLDHPKEDGDNDAFDVAVEDALTDRPAAKRSKHNARPSSEQKAQMPRHVRDNKYGFGGLKKGSKRNTKESTDSFMDSPRKGTKGSFSSGRGAREGGSRGRGRGGGTKRLGKSRRMSERSKK